jgi:hypothetical protein
MLVFPFQKPLIKLLRVKLGGAVGVARRLSHGGRSIRNDTADKRLDDNQSRSIAMHLRLDLSQQQATLWQAGH